MGTASTRCSTACRSHFEDVDCADVESNATLAGEANLEEDVESADLSALRQLEWLHHKQGSVPGAARGLGPSAQMGDAGDFHTLRPEASVPSSVPAGAIMGPAPEVSPRLIVFDWDDTLLPTSFIKALPEAMHAPGLQLATLPFYNDIVCHVGLIKTILRTARRTAKVCIVTLSMRPWVMLSAEMYLPGLDIEALLSELDIPVYYASDFAGIGQSVSDLSVSLACKTNAMSECLKQLVGPQLPPVQRVSMMSVGDSLVEQQACKECLLAWARFKPRAPRPVCQTVKMMDRPSLHALSDQLRFLTPCLSSLSYRDEDFDLCLDGCTNLAAALGPLAAAPPPRAMDSVNYPSGALRVKMVS